MWSGMHVCYKYFIFALLQCKYCCGLADLQKLPLVLMITKLQCVVEYYRLVRCITNCSLCHDQNTTTFETGCLSLLSVCITEPASYNAETYVFYWELIFWNVCSFSCKMIFLWNYIFNVFKKFVIYFCVYTCIHVCTCTHTHTQFLYSCVYDVCGEDNMERILNL
jgi:hypothetical protein